MNKIPKEPISKDLYIGSAGLDHGVDDGVDKLINC